MNTSRSSDCILLTEHRSRLDTGERGCAQVVCKRQCPFAVVQHDTLHEMFAGDGCKAIRPYVGNWSVFRDGLALWENCMSRNMTTTNRNKLNALYSRWER
jgi:hypothetical protein